MNKLNVYGLTVNNHVCEKLKHMLNVCDLKENNHVCVLSKHNWSENDL
jgi:hypothetical protein